MFQIKPWSEVVHGDAVPQNMTISNRNCEHPKVQTILRVIYLQVAFLPTSVEQNSAQYSIRRCLPIQIRGNHEKCNRHDWRKRSRPQSCVRHAGSRVSSSLQMVLCHQPPWTGRVESGEVVRPNWQSQQSSD